jgi:hypothetical protein
MTGADVALANRYKDDKKEKALFWEGDQGAKFPRSRWIACGSWQIDACALLGLLVTISASALTGYFIGTIVHVTCVYKLLV